VGLPLSVIDAILATAAAGYPLPTSGATESALGSEPGVMP